MTMGYDTYITRHTNFSVAEFINLRETLNADFYVEVS